MKEMEGAADVLMVADPDDLPRAAVGADHGLAAVRPPFQRRPPGAVRHAPSLSQRARSARRSAATISSPASRSNSTSSSSKTRSMAPEDAGQPGAPPVGQPADARLSVSDRAALRPDGAGAGNHPPRRRWRSACRCARSRSSSARASANSPSQPTTGLDARRHHGAVSQRREADRAPPRLSRHLHVPAEIAERDVASGWHLHQSLVVAHERRERLHGAGWRRGAVSPFGRALSRRPAGARPRRRPCSPRRPSTATSATAPTRWRPTARSGAATTAAS